MTSGAQHSEMESGGYYNAHSRPQGSASELGIPLLERAARELPLDGPSTHIADLGSSQGKNSMLPMRAAIAAIRARNTQQTIGVTHTDLASNDFTALFELLQSSPASYLHGVADVYAYAAGRSFYGRLFPAGSLHLGWNSIAVHWLSAVPCAIPNHIWSPYAQGTVREAFRARAAQDWNAFLDARAAEFRSGGELVVVASSADGGGFAGAEGLMNMANEELLAMVRRRRITADRYDAMAIPTYYRTKAEFEAPFTESSSFELLESIPQVLDDPYWPEYERTRDAAAFAASYTAFFRAFSEPCLFGQAGGAPADEFYAGVQNRIAADPAAAVCRWQLLLLRARRRPR